MQPGARKLVTPLACVPALLAIQACASSEYDATLGDTVADVKLEGSLVSLSVTGEGSVDLQLGGGARATPDGWLCPVYGDELRMFMNDGEMKVTSRGGYVGGTPAVLKSSGSPPGCVALEAYVDFKGARGSDPRSPPAPAADAATVAFRIVDRGGTISFEVASPTAMRSVSLVSPVGRAIAVGEPVTFQWQPASDTLRGGGISYCTFGPPNTPYPHPCLAPDGTVTPFESAAVNPTTIGGYTNVGSGGTYDLPTTLTFPMPSVAPGDGRFAIGALVLAGVPACPFGGGCEFSITGDPAAGSTIPVTVAP